MEGLVTKSLVDTNFWKNKKVFLTGHTGFKGGWAALWLAKMGANVTGYSLPATTTPSLYQEANIKDIVDSRIGDIRDIDNLRKAVAETKPEIVIHMAAQPLVRYSYKNPVETFMTNVMGLVHLFEAVRAVDSVRAMVNVTSDKCYDNKERIKGYVETEAMGGHDPYSSSKGCAELVTAAYRKSFFAKQDVAVASGRAGNVIGGGDWAEDRLVPDIVRAVLNDSTLTVRNPRAIRPWQHVLDPVAGYFILSQKLFVDGQNFAEGFNFGPAENEACDVETILTKMNKAWNGKVKYQIVTDENQVHEANYLKLNCEKARMQLHWQPNWGIDQALEKTVTWNLHRLDKKNPKEICLDQIDQYATT